MKTLEAYESIKNLLLDHQLVPGQNLVSRNLEQKLNMSRTPIINALTRLEQEGFVVSRANYGFYVRETSLEEVGELFEIREKLENVAIDFVSQNMTDDELKELKKALMAYKKYSHPVYDRHRLDLDIKFHTQIVSMGKKPYYTELMNRFYQNFYFKLNTMLLTTAIAQFTEDHDQLYEALVKRDFKKATRLATLHQRRARKIILKTL